MLPSLEPAPPADERDARFDAAAAQFAAPLARLAGALEDGHSGCEALLQDIHVALWYSFADYDTGMPLRTWVFRVALQAVAKHQPNMQDKDPRTMPVREAWASRRRLAKLVSLDELAIGELRSPTGLVHQLVPLDREIALLYLEGVDVEEAMKIGGWASARLEAAYERVGKLLLPGAREAWQQRGLDAQPVTRFLVHSRLSDLRTRRKREYGWPLAVVPVLTLMMVVLALTANRVRWFAAAGVTLLAIAVIDDAWRSRRRFLADPTPGADARLDSRSFHRRLLDLQLDDLRTRWGWRAWVVSTAVLLLAISYPLEREAAWGWAIAFGAGLVAGVALYRLSDLQEAKRLRTRIDTVI